MTDLVARARDLAHRAHAEQVDKVGRPYIEHVTRVAAAVQDDPTAEAVAWLHDVLEDCGARFKGEVMHDYPTNISYAVRILTRCKSVPGSKYYSGIRRDPVALRVKLADIADNSDEARLALLPPNVAARLRRKYAKALQALGVSEGKPYRCLYCGAPSDREESEQSPPSDYCHPEDHESFDA